MLSLRVLGSALVSGSCSGEQLGPLPCLAELAHSGDLGPLRGVFPQPPRAGRWWSLSRSRRFCQDGAQMPHGPGNLHLSTRRPERRAAGPPQPAQASARLVPRASDPRVRWSIRAFGTAWSRRSRTAPWTRPRPLRRAMSRAPTPQRTSELPRDLRGPELRPRRPREGALTSGMEGERPPAGPRTPCVASGVRPAGSAWASSGRGDDGSGPRGRAGWEWAMDPGLGLSRPGAARHPPTPAEQAKLMVPTPHWSSGSPSHRWQENHACVWASSQDHQLTT